MGLEMSIYSKVRYNEYQNPLAVPTPPISGTRYQHHLKGSTALWSFFCARQTQKVVQELSSYVAPATGHEYTAQKAS